MFLFPAVNSVTTIPKNMDSISCKQLLGQRHTAYRPLKFGKKIHKVFEIKDSYLRAT